MRGLIPVSPGELFVRSHAVSVGTQPDAAISHQHNRLTNLVLGSVNGIARGVGRSVVGQCDDCHVGTLVDPVDGNLDISRSEIDAHLSAGKLEDRREHSLRRVVQLVVPVIVKAVSCRKHVPVRHKRRRARGVSTA